MQVEEDPSSRYVDYTNATPFESFASELEDLLREWELAEKGAVQLDTKDRSIELKYEGQTYTLHLVCLSSLTQGNESSPTPCGKYNWKEGIKHFTPTMLSIVDSSSDFEYFSSSDEDAVSSSFSSERNIKNLQKWFGVADYLVLTKSSLADYNYGMDSSEASLMLSMLSLALSNCNCSLPAFVPTHHISRGAFIGCCVPGSNGCVSIYFDTDQVPELSKNQSCIAGLIDFFKLKLRLPLDSNELDLIGNKLLMENHIDDNGNCVADYNEATTGTSSFTSNGQSSIWVSASFQYSWRQRDCQSGEGEDKKSKWRRRRFSEEEIEQGLPDLLMKEEMQRRETDVLKILRGTCKDPLWGPENSPLAGIKVETVWNNLKEGSFVDNTVHSTLNPLEAPEWRIRLEWKQEFGDLGLTNIVRRLLAAYTQMQGLSQGTLISDLASNNAQYLTRRYSTSLLSEAVPAARAAATFGSAIGSLTQSLVQVAVSGVGKPDQSTVDEIICELFTISTATLRFDAEGKVDEDIDPEVNLRTSRQRSSGYEPKADKYEELSNSNQDFDSADWNRVLDHAVPIGQMVSLLAFRMGELVDIPTMSLLWMEFVRHLRKQWDEGSFISRMGISKRESDYMMSTGYISEDLVEEDLIKSNKIRKLLIPNLHFNLLHQKLQMLNFCIYRRHSQIRQRIKTTKMQSNSVMDFVNDTDVWESSDLEFDIDGKQSTTNSDSHEDQLYGGESSPKSDDEFFDTTESEGKNEQDEMIDYYLKIRVEEELKVSPSGRLKALGQVSLSSKLPMFIPITQEGVPVTEDMLLQQQEILSRLGGSAEATRVRHQLQSGGLKSDMESFRAANPGCVMADFVRWHSPKDWIPWDRIENKDEILELSKSITSEIVRDGSLWYWKGEGVLSERMRDTNGSVAVMNVWRKLWRSSNSIAASKQRPLINSSQEAEKALHYLETLSPHEMFHQVLVAALANSVFILREAMREEHVNFLSSLQPVLDNVTNQAKSAIEALDEASACAQQMSPLSSISPVSSSQMKEMREPSSEKLSPAQARQQVAWAMAIASVERVLIEISEAEQILTRARCLLHLLPGQTRLINELLHHDGQGCILQGDDERFSILRIFQDNVTEMSNSTDEHVSLSLLGNPFRREYLLRCVAPRPFHQWNNNIQSNRVSSASHPVVSRLYAKFDETTVRFALALGESEF